MKLTSDKAMELLENSRGLAKNDNWIEHSICVGNTAGVIAKALNLDEDKAKTLGYIHDIGKRNGVASGHVVGGYEYLLSIGIDEEYANICLTHSYLNNDIECVAGGFLSKDKHGYDFLKNFIKTHKYNEYEKLINLCDLLCTKQTIVLEKRLVELVIRHGVFSNTIYHFTEAQKLKQYFDDLLGYNLYSLFPQIIYN